MSSGDVEPDLAAGVVIVPTDATPSTYGICELQDRLYIFTPCCGRPTEFVGSLRGAGNALPGTPARNAYCVECKGCDKSYRGFSDNSISIITDKNTLKRWIEEWTGLKDVEISSV